ncbi:hypothetical protein [Klebsiella grimontii]|uniref:hypothetical protein n=1 Tax=Klebsiella grimontii TaxID=2058152 RepID=UPI000DD3DCE4|nr:hypothetical protein [Klebsiella grimontii]
MSIKLTQVINGLTVPDCIISIGAMTISADRSSLYFNVGFYSASEGPMLDEEYYVFTGFELTGDDPESQAYTYLKSLSRFSGAVDA